MTRGGEIKGASVDTEPAHSPAAEITSTGEAAWPRLRARLLAFAWRLDTPLGLVTMFAFAFLIRVGFAPWVSFYFDVHDHARVWAGELADVGPHRFYSVDTS